MIVSENTTLDELKNTIDNQLRLAIDEKGHPFRYCSLATAGDHEIDIRYVVLRELNENKHLFFYSDSRTNKVKAININHQVALLFYHAEEKFQLRVLGHAKVHYHNELWDGVWNSISSSNRKEYLSEKRPGEAINNPESAHQWLNPEQNEHFAVIEIVPQKMDALQLSKKGHIRAQFTLRLEKWEGCWVAP